MDSGKPREALNYLQGVLEREPPKARRVLGFVLQQIALIATHLGQEDDGRDGFDRALHHAKQSKDGDVLRACQALSVERSYLHGDYENASYAARNFLKREFGRRHNPNYVRCTAILAASLLRQRQIEEAEKSANRALQDAPTLARDPGRMQALLLLGEIDFWKAVRRTKIFEGLMLSKSTIGIDSRKPVDHLRAAGEMYQRALAYAEGSVIDQRLAETGIRLSNIAVAFGLQDWHWLDAQLKWLQDGHWVLEQDALRLRMGIVCLMHGDFPRALTCLRPLVQPPVGRESREIEVDAYFCASIALNRIGDNARGFELLNTYLARIGERRLGHLSEHSVLDGADEYTRLSHASRDTQLRHRSIARGAITAIIRKPNQHFDSLTLSNEAGVSRRTFENAMRQLTGKSPKKFIADTRLDFAMQKFAKLMPRKKHEIESVASAIGFPSYRAFVRAYQRVYKNHPIEMLSEGFWDKSRA